MDKIYFLVDCAHCVSKKSFSMLDDECLFGSSSSSALKGCNEEPDEVIGATTERNSNEW